MTERRIINQFTRYENEMGRLESLFKNQYSEHIGNQVTEEEETLSKYPEYESFAAEESKLLYIFGLPNIKECSVKLRMFFPKRGTRYSMNVLEIINQFDSYAKKFLLNDVIYRFDHINLALKNEDPFEDVAFAIKIENNTYARFIYKKLFCLGKCSQKQFFNEVDKIDKALSDKIEAAYFMCFVDFKDFQKTMQRLKQLAYISEYIEIAKNGGYAFSAIFMETPWYNRPRYGG